MEQYRNSIRQMLRVTACVLTLITLGGCARDLPGQNSYCLIYQPVYGSVRDTEPTREANDMNNAAWLELCSGERV